MAVDRAIQVHIWTITWPPVRSASFTTLSLLTVPALGLLFLSTTGSQSWLEFMFMVPCVTMRPASVRRCRMDTDSCVSKAVKSYSSFELRETRSFSHNDRARSPKDRPLHPAHFSSANPVALFRFSQPLHSKQALLKDMDMLIRMQSAIQSSASCSYSVQSKSLASGCMHSRPAVQSATCRQGMRQRPVLPTCSTPGRTQRIHLPAALHCTMSPLVLLQTCIHAMRRDCSQ